MCRKQQFHLGFKTTQMSEFSVQNVQEHERKKKKKSDAPIMLQTLHKFF